MTSILRRTSAFSAHEKPVTGDIKMSFVGNDHLGWLKCDGRSLSNTAYALLYNVVGYQFGGSGASFNLPNPAGGVLGVVGQRAGAVSTTLHGPGTEVGAETHTLTVPQMPAHTHTGTTDSAGLNVINPITVVETVVAAHTTTAVQDNAGTHTHTFTTNGTGGGEAHNNMQPTLFIGNVFIFSGVLAAGSYPGTVGLNPPLI
jgi:microcystin-dependent protein